METFTFEQLYHHSESFFELINGLADFFSEVHTFYFYTVSDQAPLTITTSTVDLLIGGGLVFLLGFRLAKYWLDIVL